MTSVRASERERGRGREGLRGTWDGRQTTDVVWCEAARRQQPGGGGRISRIGVRRREREITERGEEA